MLQLRAVVGVPYGDPRRIFNQGTPRQVWHLKMETWTVVGAPFNARFTEDISGWERVCEKIIEANGTIVLDDNFWTGRRARKIHGEGDRKTKFRKREGKSKLSLALPIYPALMGNPHGFRGRRGDSRGRVNGFL